MRIIRERQPDKFTVIDNALFKGGRLSFRAIGVYAYLIGRPDGWKTDAQQVADLSPREGREAVRTAIRELVDVGLVRIDRRKMEGGRWFTVMVVHDTTAVEPKNHTPETRSRVIGRSVRPKTERSTSPNPLKPGEEGAVDATRDERADPLAGVDLPEFTAKLRVLRRENDLPETRWHERAVRKALLEAIDSTDRTVNLAMHALEACAVLADTEQPGRLKGEGPWWDQPLLAHLAEQRAARQARAAAARQRMLDCTRCDDHGWTDLADGTGVTRCTHPDLSPSTEAVSA